MPELPEVETVRRSLANHIIGQRIAQVEVLSWRAIRPRTEAEFASGLLGRTIVAVDRRGKYLELTLDDGSWLLIHLRMTGQLLVTDKDQPLAKHTAVVFTFDSGKQLRFVDQRKFGLLEHIKDRSEAARGYQTLGVEPTSSEFTVDYLREVMARRTAKVKGLLLNQSLIAGLGNIYADEALFHAGIHPQREGRSLTEKELEELHRAIVTVIEEGITHRGTTIRNYVDGSGKSGGYQERLQVYGKEGDPCPRCKTTRRVKVAGRSSFHCPNCQR